MLDNNDKKEIAKLIDLMTRKTYDKRVGDTPNDALQLIPKKYLGFADLTVNRPASIIGSMTRQYFNTTDGKPWFYNPSASVWVLADGSVVASN